MSKMSELDLEAEMAWAARHTAGIRMARKAAYKAGFLAGYAKALAKRQKAVKPAKRAKAGLLAPWRRLTRAEIQYRRDTSQPATTEISMWNESLERWTTNKEKVYGNWQDIKYRTKKPKGYFLTH